MGPAQSWGNAPEYGLGGAALPGTCGARGVLKGYSRGATRRSIEAHRCVECAHIKHGDARADEVPDLIAECFWADR
jgi:hypothetical protein